MTTIQGSISRLVDNSSAMFESLSYVSSNIANYSTDSYKSPRFETFMTADGMVQGRTRVDHSPGSLLATYRELDTSIDGIGYIPITDSKGNTAYTRGGSFAKNAEGYIVTGSGWLVGGGIKLPANYEQLKIKPDGTVNVLTQKEGEWKEIGKIPLVVFKNPEGLEAAEGSIFKETEKSGKPELVLEHDRIKQCMLERPNFDAYALISDTLKVNASIMAGNRFIKIMDDLYRDSISLR